MKTRRMMTVTHDDEVIEETPIVEIKEEMGKVAPKISPKVSPRESPKESPKESLKDNSEEKIIDSKINENLLKFIEDLVAKTLNKCKPISNRFDKINKNSLKILEAKVKNNKIINKSRTSFKAKDKFKKKPKVIPPKKPLNWIYLN